MDRTDYLLTIPEESYSSPEELLRASLDMMKVFQFMLIGAAKTGQKWNAEIESIEIYLRKAYKLLEEKHKDDES